MRNVIKRAPRYFILNFIVLGILGCGNAPHPKTLSANSDGNALLKKQSFQSALDTYIEALKYDPFLSELHLNMGLAFEGLEFTDKAMQSYRTAQRVAVTPQLKFMALFNEAQLLGKAKKIDEALAAYQQALEILPTSKEAKTNIELLTQDQQGEGGGDGDKKQDPQDKDGKDSKDSKDGKGKDPKDDKKDDKGKDEKDDKDKEKKDQKNKQVQGSPKYQPRKFEGKDLSESDVKKILGELRQQEQKIRAEFNRKEVKEQPRDKDW